MLFAYNTQNWLLYGATCSRIHVLDLNGIIVWTLGFLVSSSYVFVRLIAPLYFHRVKDNRTIRKTAQQDAKLTNIHSMEIQ